jgi:hypothetical protein
MPSYFWTKKYKSCLLDFKKLTFYNFLVVKLNSSGH